MKLRDLKPTTRQHYASLLERQINPTFGHFKLADISPASVRVWHATLDSTRPTLRAHAYGLLRTILGTAVDDREIDSNPCHIRGAGNSKRVEDQARDTRRAGTHHYLDARQVPANGAARVVVRAPVR